MKLAATIGAATVYGLSGLAYGMNDAAVSAGGVPGSGPDDPRATFVSVDDGAPGKMAPSAVRRERVAAAWDRPVRDVPPELRAAELPTYYMVGGRAAPMTVDASRILVRHGAANIPGGRDQIAAAARAVGVPVAGVYDTGIAGYVFVAIGGGGVIGEDGVDAVIEMLLVDAGMEYAAPVFESPEIAGGFVAFLPEINLRVSQANALNAPEVVRNAVKNGAVVATDIAGLIGTAQVRTDERNGFRVLKLANELAMNPELAWACPTMASTMEFHAYTPNDDLWGNSSMWGWKNDGSAGGVVDMDCDADQAWDLTRGQSSIIVVCLDLGSDQTHPDISQLSGQDFSDGSVNGTGNGNPVTSCDNHGTPVAGIISGRINNSLGGAGVCPNGRALSAKVGTTPEPAVGDPCGGAWASTSNPATGLDIRLANALNWGEGQNARISNNSYGIGESDLLTDVFNDTSANGMLHFASTGNGGGTAIGYPARLATVQAVGAIDRDGTLSSFSNTGTGIDFVAPGTFVLAADRQGGPGYSGTDYTNFSGTSAACPFAAGCAALIWSAYPDFTDDGIANLMKFYATDLVAAGYDTNFGWGFPNVHDAIRAVTPYNNWCDQSIEITTDAYNPAQYSVGNASEVPEEYDENCESSDVGVSHSVWYRFVPPCNGELSINTNGSAYDTVLSVFQGVCYSSVTQVACDDDSGTGTASQIVGANVSAGVSYLIKVSAWGPSNAGGLLDFNFLYESNSLTNDQCGQAFDIPFNQLDLTACTRSATTVACEGDESCAGPATSRSVWYQFTTPSIGRFNLNTLGSGYDTVLSVWRGACGGSFTIGEQTFCTTVPTQVACNDDFAPGVQSRIQAQPADAFTTYLFKIAQYGTPAQGGGDMNFHFEFVPCPADYNLSGTVTVQDLFDFLAGYFANDPRANFNNFGGHTVQDIFDYLAAYFGGGC